MSSLPPTDLAEVGKTALTLAERSPFLRHLGELLQVPFLDLARSHKIMQRPCLIAQDPAWTLCRPTELVKILHGSVMPCRGAVYLARNDPPKWSTDWGCGPVLGRPSKALA